MLGFLEFRKRPSRGVLHRRRPTRHSPPPTAAGSLTLTFAVPATERFLSRVVRIERIGNQRHAGAGPRAGERRGSSQPPSGGVVPGTDPGRAGLFWIGRIHHPNLFLTT